MRQVKIVGLMALLGAVLIMGGCGSDGKLEFSVAQKKAIVSRITPAGELAMEGDAIASAPVVAASSGPRSGEDIYKKSCFACHTTGAAGAPKIGDAAAWGPRISKGIETLYEHAWKGFKTMPAKGNCFDCSQDEIKSVVDYLVEKAK